MKLINKTHRNFYALLQLIIGFSSFFIFINYFWREMLNELIFVFSSYEKVFKVTIIFILLKTISYFLKSIHTSKLYSLFSIKIKTQDFFSMSVIQGIMATFLPLNLSTGLKMIYLKIRYKLKFLNFGKMELLSFFIFYYGYFCFFITGILGFYFKHNVFVSLLIFSFIICFFPLIQKLTVGILKLENFPKFDFKTYFYGIANDIAYYSALYFLIVIVLKYDISFHSILIYTFVIQISMIINITPSNIGLREWFMALVAPLVGLDHNQGALISILDRTLSIIFLLIFYPYSYKVLFINTKIKSNKILENFTLDA